MPLVDTHCHLQSPRFDADRQEVMARCREKLDWLVVIGDDLPSSHAACALAGPQVHATVGLHPYHAAAATPETLEELRSLAGQPGVVAIGEIGLDYFNEYAPREVQARGFQAQLELAAELGKPVVIHNRDSDADAAALLAAYLHRVPGVVMHCFGSNAAFAAHCVQMGCFVSFAGNVTFPKAEALREAADAVPLDRILVETDAPYLAPVPLRGQRCEPWHVEHTARCLAERRGVPFEEFCAITTANAARFYGLSA
jgi:TatD DNase family protein